MAFAMLLVTAATADTVSYEWTITNITVNYDGISRWALGVNNRSGFEVPIELHTGDTLKLRVKNSLQVPTSIHFHGLLQRGSVHMDGTSGITQCPIPPGGEFTYEFSTGEQEGTFWWHGHFVAQYVDGLRGPLIIRPKENPASYVDEALLQLADWYHEGADYLIAQYLSDFNPEGVEPMFHSGLINGRGSFDCSKAIGTSALSFHGDCKPVDPAIIAVRRGRPIRMRAINMAAFATFILSIDSHKLVVIEVDGIEVDPYVVDAIPMNVGQRVSFLVHPNLKGGDFTIHASIPTGTNYTPDPPPGFIPTVSATMRYSDNDSRSLPHQRAIEVPEHPHPKNRPFIMVDSELSPSNVVPAPVVTPDSLRLVFEFSFAQRDGDKFMKAYPVAYTLPERKVLFNGSFVTPEVPLLKSVFAGSNTASASNTVTLSPGQVVEMVIVNRDPGADNPGVWFFHCHIEWHIQAGLAMAFIEIPDVVRSRPGIGAFLDKTCTSS
ncbi:hypothetical protein HDU67_009528 [Dinochytrium kinnereticum]|nr:hypothetical protein HDU67_009528 [Dinochytrium kinnereticum]